VTRSAIAALALAVMLGGCFAGSDPKPDARQVSTPKGGDCYADAASKPDLVGPDFSSKVKCTKPHLYEVTGVSPIPDRFLVGARKTQRDRLLDPSEADAGSFARFADAACTRHLWRALGRRTAAAQLSDLGAMPATYGITFAHTLTPEAEWTKGHHRVVCLAEFADPEPGLGPSTATPVSSYNLRPVFSMFLGRHFPPERRQCAVQSDPGKIRPEPCTDVHDAETIVTFDARLALGMPFVRKLLRAGLTSDVSRRAVSVCDQILPLVFGSRTQPDLEVWFWTGNDAENAWDYQVADSADETAVYPIDCQVRPRDSDLIFTSGSVLGDGPLFEDRSSRAVV